VDTSIEHELDEGIRLEQALRWREAEEHYRRALSAAKGEGIAEADLRMRRANALLELKRFDEARAEFDEALTSAKTTGDPAVLARALVGAGVFAASRGDLSRGEEFLLAALDAFLGRHDRDGIQGEGWALLNLAAIYGRTKRLDLAFLTFEKARARLFTVENWVGVATAWELQARLRESLGDPDRVDQDFHEAMVFYEKQGMSEKVKELRARAGGRRVV